MINFPDYSVLNPVLILFEKRGAIYNIWTGKLALQFTRSQEIPQNEHGMSYGTPDSCRQLVVMISKVRGSQHFRVASVLHGADERRRKPLILRGSVWEGFVMAVRRRILGKYLIFRIKIGCGERI